MKMNNKKKTHKEWCCWWWFMSYFIHHHYFLLNIYLFLLSIKRKKVFVRLKTCSMFNWIDDSEVEQDVKIARERERENEGKDMFLTDLFLFSLLNAKLENKKKIYNILISSSCQNYLIVVLCDGKSYLYVSSEEEKTMRKRLLIWTFLEFDR